MGIPVVIKPSGGLPVTVATNGFGLPMTVATNGFGLAVTQAPAGGGGLAVTGITFGPTIALSAASVLETAAVNTVVGTLSVTAGTTGSPVFALVDSAGGKFNISGTSLRTNALLDYETATFHSITVSVTGVTPTVANATFIIFVQDVVEPVILLTGTMVDENATAGTNIGVLSIAKNGANPQMTEEEIRAVVTTARDYGFKVAAHAHGAEGIKRAVRGGVDSIEHGTFMDDEGMRLMKEHGTYYVPTISAGRWVYEQAQDPEFFPPIVRPKALEVGPQIQRTFSRAYKSGVKIMFGTDTGVSKHGDNAREFRYMVEGGMPAMEAIRAATSVPAKFLEIDDRTGSIAVGKLGELVGVPGDPLTDISVMEHVVFVMKDDTIYKAP